VASSSREHGGRVVWSGNHYNYDEGDGAFGHSVHAGLRVHLYFGLEVSYLDPATIRWDKDLVQMSISRQRE
jgi:hypothetical protein